MGEQCRYCGSTNTELRDITTQEGSWQYTSDSVEIWWCKDCKRGFRR